MADRNHIVIEPHTEGTQAELQRSRAARHRDSMRRTDESSQLALKRRHLRPLCHPARADNARDGLDFILA